MGRVWVLLQVSGFGGWPYLVVLCLLPFPRGSIYTTTMEVGPQNHNEDALWGPNSILPVYMDLLG